MESRVAQGLTGKNRLATAAALSCAEEKLLMVLGEELSETRKISVQILADIGERTIHDTLAGLKV